MLVVVVVAVFVGESFLIRAPESMLHKSRRVDSANRPKLKMHKLPVNKIRVQMKIYRKYIAEVCRLDSICTNIRMYIVCISMSVRL